MARPAEHPAARIDHKTTCALNATGHRGPCTCGAESSAAQDRARDTATKLYEEHGTSIIQMRSCWNCNEAHEHLKSPDAGVISCFSCGHYFYDGQDITEEADDADTE